MEAVARCGGAGLGAWEVAGMLVRAGLLPGAAIPRRHLARGCYFSLSGVRAPFQRLVYPVPESGGLGVHLTLDLAGGWRMRRAFLAPSMRTRARACARVLDRG